MEAIEPTSVPVARKSWRRDAVRVVMRDEYEHRVEWTTSSDDVPRVGDTIEALGGGVKTCRVAGTHHVTELSRLRSKPLTQHESPRSRPTPTGPSPGWTLRAEHASGAVEYRYPNGAAYVETPHREQVREDEIDERVTDRRAVIHPRAARLRRR